MSWLFSQALVEAFSEENSLGGEQCAQLNVMPTPQLFWRNDKPMDVLSRSPFGLTGPRTGANAEPTKLYRLLWSVLLCIALKTTTDADGRPAVSAIGAGMAMMPTCVHAVGRAPTGTRLGAISAPLS